MNWRDFGLRDDICQTLTDAGFEKPTKVQQQSLAYLQNQDLIISARTGEGKTLTFLLPALQSLLGRIDKGDVTEDKFIHTLILTPTRELALQIKEHFQKVLPVKYRKDKRLKVCCLVGKMSLHKQERELADKPAVIIGTPGRIWDLLDDSINKNIHEAIPFIKQLVLDEADRMVEIGHFRELTKITQFIYTHRAIETETNALSLGENMLTSLDGIEQEATEGNIEEVNVEIEGPILTDEQVEAAELASMSKRERARRKNNHDDMIQGKKKEAAADPTLLKKKLTGLQTIVCSATLTMEAKGRLKNNLKQKASKSKKKSKAEDFDAIEEIIRKLEFSSKKPKVIDLVQEVKMPELLTETYKRCHTDDKDLYLFYFLQQHPTDPTIVFTNSITCLKRVSSILKILKVPHSILFSKMQMKQRLKNLDRFKKRVANTEVTASNDSFFKAGLLVTTDVAARGLDIPDVKNVVNYQMPVNAETYVHRCGRTARIGKGGLSYSLFSPEDEKNFRLIYRTLNKGKIFESATGEEQTIGDITEMEVDFQLVEKYKKFINQVKDIENAMFQQKKKNERADWVLNLSKETDIEIPPEMRNEIEGLEKKENEQKNKRDQKAAAKKKERRSRGDMKASTSLNNVGKTSSYLNPDSVKYLNTMLYEGENQDHAMNKAITIDYTRQEVEEYKKKKTEKVRYRKDRRKKRKRHFLAPKSRK